MLCCGIEDVVYISINLSCSRKDDQKLYHNVKIQLQLFKVTERKYLLDVKKIEGDTFLFFDACSKLLEKLKI